MRKALRISAKSSCRKPSVLSTKRSTPTMFDLLLTKLRAVMLGIYPNLSAVCSISCRFFALMFPELLNTFISIIHSSAFLSIIYLWLARLFFAEKPQSQTAGFPRVFSARRGARSKFNKEEREKRLPLPFPFGGDFIQSLIIGTKKCSFGTGGNRSVEAAAGQARHD